jgi:hypothetical protein
MKEDHVILDRMTLLRKWIKARNTDNPFDEHVIEYRRLLCRLWTVPLHWEHPKQEPNDRFRARGTRHERMINRLQYDR